MTTAELNRDIKRLAKREKKLSLIVNDNSLYESELSEIRGEFLRLYNADRSFEFINAQSIRIMLRLNLRHRFIVLHHFGLDIELN